MKKPIIVSIITFVALIFAAQVPVEAQTTASAAPAKIVVAEQMTSYPDMRVENIKASKTLAALPKPKPKPKPVVHHRVRPRVIRHHYRYVPVIRHTVTVSRSVVRQPLSYGSPKAYARSVVGDSQFSCLNSLWNRESGWNTYAYNPSGAYGIPQALPGSKMASAGSDWRTNPITQVKWGLGYINSVYGSPCNAWAHSQSHGWY